MPKRQIARQPTSALLLAGCIWFLTGTGSPRLRVIPQLLWRSVISRMGRFCQRLWQAALEPVI